MAAGLLRRSRQKKHASGNLPVFVPSIGITNDPVLRARSFSYRDTQFRRIEAAAGQLAGRAQSHPHARA
ncbi:catalase [Sphingomonas oryzagri]